MSIQLSHVAQHFSKLYLAAFLRAPDLGGLNYWSDKVTLEGLSFQTVGGIIFSLPVVTAIYPGTLSDLDFVEAIYENVFGRASDAEGLNYWAHEIAALRTSYAAQGSGNAAFEARGQLVMNMMDAGLGTPDGTDGKAYIVNRLDVVEYAVERQLQSGIEISPAQLLLIESSVNADASSVTQGIAAVDSFYGDITAPTLQFVSVNGATLMLSYSEVLNAASDTAAGSFVVTVDGSPVAVSSVDAHGNVVVLVLTTAVSYGQAVSISYTIPAAHPIEDLAGNDAAAFSNRVVNNVTGDTTPPVVPTLSLANDTGSIANDGITSNGTVNVSGLESNASWAYSTNGGTNWVVGVGNSVSFSLDGSVSLMARQTDAAGNVSANSAILSFTLDRTTPLLSSASVSGNTLTLAYSEALDATSDAAVSSFMVSVDGIPVTVNSVNANGMTVTLTLDAAVTYGQRVTLDYVPPVSSPIQDMAGNTVAALSGFAINNLASAPDLRSGTLITDFFGSQDAARALGVQADGRIVLAGYADHGSSDFALVRYNTDGSLDTAFDGDGKLTTNFFTVNSAGSSDAGYGLVLLADGKMLVGGYAYNGSNGYNFALAKYNANGSLDTGFDADGKLVTDIAGSAGAEDKGFSLSVDANGKILMAGYSSVSGNSNFALVRYNANGSLDTSFDVDGKLTTDISGSLDEGHDIALQADGKILVSGFSYAASDRYDFTLVRYNTDGSLDTGFDADGKITTDFAGNIDYGYSVTIQNDQKILVAGYTYSGSDSYDFALARYNTDGGLDAGFGMNGKLVTDFAGAQDFAHKVVVQPNGKIIVAGNSFNGSDYDFALARYNANGSLDTSFGSGGKVSTDFAATHEYGYDVSVDANGKIIVAGYAFNGSHNDFALARYNSDGSLDVGNFGHLFLTSGDHAERLTLTARSDDRDIVNAYFGKSTQANLDTLEVFTLGSDAIHLANAPTKPTSLVRLADVASSDNLASSLSASFSGVVAANAAALVVIQSGLAAGTYLYANDGNAAYSVLDDVFVQLVGLQGALGSVGALVVNDFFA